MFHNFNFQICIVYLYCVALGMTYLVVKGKLNTNIFFINRLNKWMSGSAVYMFPSLFQHTEIGRIVGFVAKKPSVVPSAFKLLQY